MTRPGDIDRDDIERLLSQVRGVRPTRSALERIRGRLVRDQLEGAMLESTEVEAILSAVRKAEPTPRAVQRVRYGLFAPKAPRRWGVPVALAGTAAMAAAAVLWFQAPDAQTPQVRVAFAEGAERSDGAPIGNAMADGSWLETGSSGRVELEAGKNRVRLGKDTRARVGATEVEVHRGRARVRGNMRVACPTCQVRVNGEADVRVDSTGSTQIVVIAGSVSQREPDVACRIVDVALYEEPAPDKVVVDAPGIPKARPARATRRHARSSELSAQVAAYEKARMLEHRNDASALQAYRKLLRKYPSSPLRPEIELNVVETLHRLGNTRAAARAARSFLKRYPSNPRAGELRRFLQGAQLRGSR